MLRDRLCSNCGIRPKQGNGKKNGKTYYKSKCARCTKYPNLKEKAKQDYCSICHNKYHWIALDCDHIKQGGGDGYDNLQIICANCHRLKSLMGKETGPKRGK